MIAAMAGHEPALRFGHTRLTRALAGAPEPGDAALYGMVDAYLGEYCAAHGMGPAEAAHGYMAFAARYQDDLRRFAATGRYPAEAGAPAPDFDRAVYDVFLLASVLATGHRFRLMAEVARLCAGAGGARLVFGAGSGLELLLPVPDGAPVTAWDRELAPFVRGRFPQAALRDDDILAPGAPGAPDLEGRFGCVLAVEVLEHFARPDAVLAALAGALAPGGLLVATTARNVPQFDHLWNFTDPAAFEARARGLGLTVEARMVVPHDYRLLRVDADNVVYALRRAGE
jgi:SAM-dependent methyltransferase